MLFFRKKLTLFEAIATLVGTVVGAGVLGIPYVVNKVGFVPGMIILAILTYAMTVRHLMVGEIVLRTRRNHQMVGYFDKYFGKWAKYAMTVAFVVGLYGSMLAYIIGSGSVLAAVFGGSDIWYSMGFVLAASVFIYIGLNIVKRSEFVLTLTIFAIIAVIIVLAGDRLHVPDLEYSDWSQAYLPYGVILFALAGSVAIPEIRRELRRNEILMKRALIWGTIIPAVIYFIFTFFALGVDGDQVTEIATVGLGNTLGRPMVVLGNLFAFFAMSTSMLTVGLAIRDMYMFDYRLKRMTAWVFTMFPPVLFLFIAHAGFTRVLNWVGGVLGGIISIATIVMFWRSRRIGEREPEYILGPMAITGAVLILMYVVGIWQVL